MEKTNSEKDLTLTTSAEETIVKPEPKKPNFGQRVGEWFRRFIVKLKRRTNNIPFVWILFCMVYFTFSLRNISNATTAGGVKNGGLLMFTVTLISILVCVLYMNAYPKRQKLKKVQLILAFVFLAVILAFDIIYYINLVEAMSSFKETAPAWVFLVATKNIIMTHIIFVVIAILLAALLPVYRNLIRKIDTSVEVESSEMLNSSKALITAEEEEGA